MERGRITPYCHRNSRKIAAPSLSIFNQGEYFLDQFPHLTAIIVIFVEAHIAARVRALEAVD